jgi:hypothetical protein
MQRSCVCVCVCVGAFPIHSTAAATAHREPDRLFIYSSPVITTLRANKFQVLINGIIIFRTHKLRRPPQSYSQHTSNMFVFLAIYCFWCVWILKVWLKKKQTRERGLFCICRIACLWCAPRMSCQPRAEGAESWVR